MSGNKATEEELRAGDSGVLEMLDVPAYEPSEPLRRLSAKEKNTWTQPRLIV